MATELNSPLFGLTRHSTDEERAAVAQTVTDIPVTVFQELNKSLNARGYCLAIATLDESKRGRPGFLQPTSGT